MNKKLKVYISVCVCLIIVGTCLAVIGLMTGANGSIELNHILWNLSDKPASINISSDSAESDAVLTGDRITESMQINQPVDAIKTKVGLGDIKIIESEQFKVVYTYDKGIGKPDINIEQGNLTIADKFGSGDVDFKVKEWSSLKTSRGIEYKIYCPKDMKIKLVEIDNNLGDIHISHIKADTLNVQLDVGDIKLTDLTVDSADVDMNLGDINTENIQSKSLTINDKMGDIAVEGNLMGQNQFDAEMGEIKIETNLEKEKYAVKLEANLGDIKVDDAEVNGNYDVNNDSGNIINASTSAGDIKVKFH